VRAVAAAVSREAVVRSSALRADRALQRVGRTGEPVVLGPFLGEIGYELEYWIPFMRRRLHRHRIAPERVTVVTRGGAALWYRDFAEHAVDVLELLPADRYAAELEARRARARDLKQLRSDPFDRLLVRLVLERTGPALVVHPSLMYARLRDLWFKQVPPDALMHELEYRKLEPPPRPPAGLPAEYVAVKAYFNECLTESDPNRAFLRDAIGRLAAETDVVLLSTGLSLDDHDEWSTSHPRVHPIEALLRPVDNLDVQTRIVAGARGLLATYGGFSYLGPFLGVPALTFYEVEQTKSVHLEVLAAALPGAAYQRVRVGDIEAVERFAVAVAR
jgi:hypothetical protein